MTTDTKGNIQSSDEQPSEEGLQSTDKAPLYEVVIIGAGFSGLCAAIQLKKSNINNFIILEKENQIGGTWRDNTYPGCACDIKGVLYSYSFELNPAWTHKYPQQPEVLAYLENCVIKHELKSHIKFNSEINSARFDEKSGIWTLEIKNGIHIQARTIISAVGQLNRPFIPDIPGQKDFSGVTFHSARWNHSYDFHNKRVAVIGNAASAIQFIPEIAPKVKQLFIFQRSANWIVKRNDRPYNRIESWLFKHLPFTLRLLRWCSWARLESLWPAFVHSNNFIMKVGLWFNIRRAPKRLLHVSEYIKDSKLQALLTPNYMPGCKRILLSDIYYATLARKNVSVFGDEIIRFTPDAIVTKSKSDGIEVKHVVDAVIYATGFKSTEFLAPMNIYGRNSISLQEKWRDGAEAYLGISLPDFPNFYILYGPNTNLGNNSIIIMVECQVQYIIQCIKYIRKHQLKYLELNEKVMSNWTQQTEADLAKTVWAADCHNWYKNENGKITNNWPYSTMTYWKQTYWVNFKDYKEASM